MFILFFGDGEFVAVRDEGNEVFLSNASYRRILDNEKVEGATQHRHTHHLGKCDLPNLMSSASS